MKVTLIASMMIAIAALTEGSAKAPQWHDRTTDAWSKVAPAEDTEVFEKVLQLRRRGDFDGAVTIALKSVHGKPPDDFLLQTVADTYFQRALGDPLERERWVSLGVQYSEKALQANPRDIVNAFNVGQSYLAAAMNLPKPRGCSYYQKSLQVFERLRTDPALKVEFGTIEGEQVPMEEYRQKLDNEIKQVQLLASGCPTVRDK